MYAAIKAQQRLKDGEFITKLVKMKRREEMRPNAMKIRPIIHIHIEGGKTFPDYLQRDSSLFYLRTLFRGNTIAAYADVQKMLEFAALRNSCFRVSKKKKWNLSSYSKIFFARCIH